MQINPKASVVRRTGGHLTGAIKAIQNLPFGWVLLLRIKLHNF